MVNWKVISGIILIIIGLALLFLKQYFIGGSLVLIGIVLIIYRQGENVIEEREDINKGNR